MPCEGCHAQFTVFKRKRSCYDCKRYYCHNCLANSHNRKHALCDRCLLFSKRPLVRSDLLKLKPKDLIFYLQSKHISTAGCVEKEELIDLVLQYVNGTNMNNEGFAGGSGSSSGNSSHQTTPQHQNIGSNAAGGAGGRSTENNFNANNSFDSIKQTCQNFFSNLGDNISDSLANLENRACSKNRPSTTMPMATTNVTEQPRVATRSIPTYASSQQNSPENPITSPIGERRPSGNASITADTLVVNLPLSVEETNRSDINQDECNCSDEEEIIATFNGRSRSLKSELELHNLSPNIDEHDSFNGTNTNSDTTTNKNCAPSTSTNTSKALSQYSKMEIYVNDEDSSHSSFEELGAIGGISDDSKTTTDTNSNTTDHWQILDLKINENETAPVAVSAQQRQTQHEQNIDKSTSPVSNESPENKEPVPESHVETREHTNHVLPTPTHGLQTPRVKKVTRRRSESYLNRRRNHTSVDDEDEDVVHILQNATIEEESQTNSKPSARKLGTNRCCTRCGKNKTNIRQQVEKMRKHLESSQMSETDIKQELSEFLTYLEQRTKSFEYSDSEAGVSTASMSRNTNEETDVSAGGRLEGQAASRCLTSVNAMGDQAEGTSSYFYDKDSRFINLDEIVSIKQMECLTVKQLKEILMLHRVDYKGCCEKQELLDRVERLWKNLKSSPAVEKLPTDELCKICMDAPIECVILECGHMATCTNCGKVLSECPICRQYIVRVVRFFRA